MWPWETAAPPPPPPPENDTSLFLWGFLSFIVLLWALELYIDLRQRRHLSKGELPQDLKSVVTQNEFADANAYSLDKNAFHMLHEALTTTAMVLFYAMGGLGMTWRLASSLCELFHFTADNEYVVSLAFSLLLFVKSTVEEIPFDLYQTFVLEERHGFNKQSFSLWLKDQLTTTALWLVFGGPVIAAIIWIVKASGPNLHLYLSAFSLGLVLLFMGIYPNLIAPLFNTFSPLQEGQLKIAIEDLAAEHNFPLKKLFVVDGSTRSSHSNAYFFGLGSNKRVVLYDTLAPALLAPGKDFKSSDTSGKEKVACTIPEIVAILAHELGHWALSHLIKGLVVTMLHLMLFFTLYGEMVSSAAMFRSFGFTEQPTLVGLVIFGNVVAPIEQVIGLFMQYMTRKHEYEADRFAVDAGRGEELAAALVKISTVNKTNIYPDKWWSAYHNSHPSLAERLAAIRAAPMAKKRI